MNNERLCHRSCDQIVSRQWGLAVPLSESGNNAWRPRLAVDPSGQVVAAWYRWNDDGDTIVQVAEKEPGEAWMNRRISRPRGLTPTPPR
jgi:hypothetical protein